MKRFPELARRGVALALAASMSLSVFMPGALAASVTTAEEHDHDHDHVHLAAENSVDALGNEDFSDEVYNVPGDTAFTAAGTAAAADPLGGDDEEEIDLDDLTEEQLAEQAVVDEAGHTEHTPDTENPVYEQPATCAERGYAIYPCSFELEQEDGTVAHCYHQVVVWLPLADHAWGEWQEPDDADSQKYRVCTVCNAVEYEDGTVVTPGSIPVTDPDHPEWLPGDIGVGGNYDDQIETLGWHTHDFGCPAGQRLPYNTTVGKMGHWIKHPTCTSYGKVRKQCASCLSTAERETEMAPHNYGGWIEEAATCTKAGRQYHKCTTCGAEEDNKTYAASHPATGHLSSNGEYWFPNDEATKNKGWQTKKATCTEDGKLYRDCVNCKAADGYEEKDIVPATGHHTGGVKWTKGDKSNVGFGDVNQPYLCVNGTKTRECDVCHEKETVKVPATEKHKYEFASTTQEHPCTAGKETWKCSVCGETEERDAKVADHTPGDWEITVNPTCTTTGTRVKKCTRCGNVVKTETIDALGHDFKNYVDDNRPACCDQYETGTCTRCGAKDPRKTSGPIRAHKFTRYVLATFDGRLATRANCDYEGCTAYDDKAISTSDYMENICVLAATEASETIANYAEEVIKQAMRDAETAVKNASTREEAIASLDVIVASVRSQLLNKKIEGEIRVDLDPKHELPDWLHGAAIIKKSYSVTVTENMVGSMLTDLQKGMNSVKEMLGSSFLSKDAIQTLIGKAADTVEKSDDINYSMRQIVYPEAYYQITAKLDGNGRYPGGDRDKAGEKATISNLILQLAGDLVQKDPNAETDAVQEFVSAIFDNLIDMLIEELKKDEDYSKYLNNALGDELLEELRPKLREELVNDTAFVDIIRRIVKNALDNAAAGVNRGWTEKAILAQFREDLLKVQGPVEQEMLDLSATIGNLVESSLAEKINKFLPFGDLTSWIGKWVGAFAKDKAVSEVVGETGKVRQTIEMYIKYITCPKHRHVTENIAATCTEPAYTIDSCGECGWRFSKEKTGEPLGHTPVTVKGYEATETADGLTDGVQCAVCSAWIEPQEVIPAEEPLYEKYLVKSAVTAETAKAAGYKNQKKLDEAIDAALTKAGYQTANSERFLAQVQTSIGILSNDRYPEDGVTGMVKLPAGAAGKNCTFYAVQVLTADTHGYSAGDVVVTPLTVTSEGISFKLPVQSVVAIAWKVNE